MCTAAHYRRLGLENPRDVQDSGSPLFIGPAFRQIGQDPRRSFHSIEALHRETRALGFRA